jgi:hypothetical protein
MHGVVVVRREARQSLDSSLACEQDALAGGSHGGR